MMVSQPDVPLQLSSRPALRLLGKVSEGMFSVWVFVTLSILGVNRHGDPYEDRARLRFFKQVSIAGFDGARMSEGLSQSFIFLHSRNMVH